MSVRLSPATLRSVRSFEDVLALLSDELDWPITTDQLEEATFDFSPEELGLPSDRVPKLESLRQLRPLTVHQPWGIFFVEFTGPRLPLTPLRRLLQRLVTAKRAGTKQHATWDLDDLLFIITTNGGDAVELHFIAFFETSDGPVEIRSLPWRPDHSPQQYLDRLARELLPHLEWPADDGDTEHWRRAWRAAFTLRHGEPIRTAQRLAERMAEVATVLRGTIAETIADEHGSGPFSTLLDEVRRELVANVDEPKFADMCAQTLVYGTLTARITDPDGFGASPTLAVVPLSNLFLAAFFEQVHDQVAELDLHDTGLEQLVADLRASNIEAVLDQFGSTAKGGDPVIHFYEEFLKRYDRQMRADAGAFYTPQPVVEAMMRLVDHILRERFGLAAGLADDTSWADVCEHLDIPVPDGIEPTAPFVNMLDPATGTGTYLVEWLRRARQSFLVSHSEADWPAHLERSVLPAVHAFELMLAPYSIAHLKVALETHAHGLVDPAIGIHLTDTLEMRSTQAQLAGLEDPVAAEGARAARLKEDGRFTIAIGNPPYDRISRDAGGGWVTEAGPDQHSLFDEILDPAREHTNFAHQASLYNLYVYFWRWSLWKVLEDSPAGVGIVSFITASSWLSGPGFLGLRQLVRELADEIWVIDLGGDNKGARPEENVFDIETPVAITTIIRTRSKNGSGPAQVRYLRLGGSREDKLGALQELQPEASDAWFRAPNGWHDPLMPPTGKEDWLDYPDLVDLFPWQQPGCKFGRTWPISPHSAILKARWRRFLSTSDPSDRADCFVTAKAGRNISTSVSGFPRLVDLPEDATHEPIVRYGYRSFDRQWAFADPRLAKTESPSLWMSRSPRQVFFVTKTTMRFGGGPAATASTAVPDLDHFRGSFGGKDVIPLYRDAGGTPNTAPETVEVVTATHRAADSATDEVTHERLFAYCYGVLAGADYTERFAVELETPGPRVPITADPALFQQMADHGEELLWLHTYGERFQGLHRPERLPTDDRFAWAKPITEIPDTPRDFKYDPDTQTLHIADGAVTGVHPDVWEFEVSGMQVVKKWLGYRTRRGAGRAASSTSPLDQIRPEEWADEWSTELFELLTVLQRTIELLPQGAELLGRICQGPQVAASELPPVPDALRRPPPASWRQEGLTFDTSS